MDLARHRRVGGPYAETATSASGSTGPCAARRPSPPTASSLGPPRDRRTLPRGRGLALSRRGIAGIALGLIGLIVAPGLLDFSGTAIRAVAALPPDAEPSGCGSECGCGGHDLEADSADGEHAHGDEDICGTGTSCGGVRDARCLLRRRDHHRRPHAGLVALSREPCLAKSPIDGFVI